MLDWGHVQEKNTYGEWDRMPEDPLVCLFVHSDCDGLLHPPQALAIAGRLQELLPRMQGQDPGHIGDVNETTKKFISGLVRAATAGEDIEFS